MKAVVEHCGSINLEGVGGIVTQSTHGIYTVKFPLSNGKSANMTGVCLDQITATFPQYPLGEVESEIKQAHRLKYGSDYQLPKLPKSIGGEIDFMIGIKYLRYHLKPVFQLPSGLIIYESVFESANGGSGMIGGPHNIFSSIEKQFRSSQIHQSTFLSNQLDLYRSGYQVNPDLSLLGYEVCNFDLHDNDNYTVENSLFVSRQSKLFSKAE